MFALTLLLLIIGILVFVILGIISFVYMVPLIFISPLDDPSITLTISFLLFMIFICIFEAILTIIDLIVFLSSKKRTPVMVMGIISTCFLNLFTIPMIIIKEDKLLRNKNMDSSSNVENNNDSISN